MSFLKRAWVLLFRDVIIAWLREILGLSPSIDYEADGSSAFLMLEVSRKLSILLVACLFGLNILLGLWILDGLWSFVTLSLRLAELLPCRGGYRWSLVSFARLIRPELYPLAGSWLLTLIVMKFVLGGLMLLRGLIVWAWLGEWTTVVPNLRSFLENLLSVDCIVLKV